MAQGGAEGYLVQSYGRYLARGIHGKNPQAELLAGIPCAERDEQQCETYSVLQGFHCQLTQDPSTATATATVSATEPGAAEDEGGSSDDDAVFKCEEVVEASRGTFKRSSDLEALDPNETEEEMADVHDPAVEGAEEGEQVDALSAVPAHRVS